MFRRVLRFDTVDGYWRMDEQQYEDMITDREVDNMDSYRAAWLVARAKQIKYERWHDRMNKILGAVCLFVFGVLVAIILGLLR